MLEHHRKDIPLPKLTSLTIHRSSTNGVLFVNEIPEDRDNTYKIGSKADMKTFIKGIKDDKSIRFNFALSIFVSLAFSVLGWTLGQMGPAFTEIIDITSTDLEKGSAFMTSYITGRLIGSAFGGFLHSHMNTYLMFAVSLIVNGIVVAVIPWCSLYELMIIAHALHGISGGVLNVVVTSTAFSIWGPTKRGRSYIQILYVAFSVSTVVAPFATAPFLSEREDVGDPCRIINLTKISTRQTNTTICCSTNTSCNATGNISSYVVPSSESTLYIAYFISAGMAIVVAIPFMALYMKRSSEIKQKSLKQVKIRFIANLSRLANCLQFINIGLISAMAHSCAFIYPSYITVFCVQYMKWSKGRGAMVTSVLLSATLCGRLLGIFLVQMMKSQTILLLSTTLYTLVSVCMTLSAHLFSEIGIWVSVAIIGLPAGVLWPSALNLTNSYLIPINGKVSSYLLVLAYLGPLAFPFLLGYLMQNVSLLWFCYVCVVLSFVILLNAIFLVLHTVFSTRRQTSYNVRISTISG